MGKRGDGPRIGRGKGRPRKGEKPRFPHREVDELLVFGEQVTNEGGHEVTHYPTYRELAERFGVAHSVIADYARSHGCLARRSDAQQRIRAHAEAKVIERRSEELAVTTADAIRIIDRYVLRFAAAVEEGSIRIDNASDLNTLLRLKQFLLGGADSRQEIHQEITLPQLQQRHHEMMRVVAETSAAERGEIGRGDLRGQLHEPESPGKLD